jgi:hypothetical protein
MPENPRKFEDFVGFLLFPCIFSDHPQIQGLEAAAPQVGKLALVYTLPYIHEASAASMHAINTIR